MKNRNSLTAVHSTEIVTERIPSKSTDVRSKISTPISWKEQDSHEKNTSKSFEDNFDSSKLEKISISDTTGVNRFPSKKKPLNIANDAFSER